MNDRDSFASAPFPDSAGATSGPGNPSAVPLLVVRHGQTGGNGNRYVGREDEPLDAVGREQAAALVGLLAGRPLDAIYCSPLSRARDTALPLADARGLAVHVRDALQEIDYGHYQGMPKADQPLRLRHDHRVHPMPGGESLLDVYRRIEGFAEEVRQSVLDGRRLAVVGHFWSNRMLVGVLLGVPFEALFEQTHYKPANGSVFEMVFDGEAAAAPRVVRSDWLHRPESGGEA